MNKETVTLNKESVSNLNDLKENKEKFRDGIINFVGDKAGLSNEQVLDKIYKYNTLNMLGSLDW